MYYFEFWILLIITLVLLVYFYHRYYLPYDTMNMDRHEHSKDSYNSSYKIYFTDTFIECIDTDHILRVSPGDMRRFPVHCYATVEELLFNFSNLTELYS